MEWVTTQEARRRFEAAVLAMLKVNTCQTTDPTRWLASMPHLIDAVGEAMATYRDTAEHWRTPPECR